jgi:hypothetical protein
MNIKTPVITLLLFTFAIVSIAQVSSTGTDKKEKRKNLTIKEWNKVVGSKTPFLDHVTTYDDKGRKIDEIEYTTYGVKERVVYEYNEGGKCSRELVYNDKNKVSRIKKYEYYSDGSKKKQYNYYPNGNLESTKEFEYIFK